MITVSTRASLKKYHTYNLILGQGESGDEWEFERIGTEREKMQVEKELHELRERLSQVDEWKKRRDEVEAELAAVWTGKGETLNAPDYIEDQPWVEAKTETTESHDIQTVTEGETESAVEVQADEHLAGPGIESVTEVEEPEVVETETKTETTETTSEAPAEVRPEEEQREAGIL